MYDSGKIITGLIIFLGLITFPSWYNLVQGKASIAPELKIVTKEKKCIEATPYMRTNHMELITLWRDSVVRDGNRIYVNSDGKKYIMSLQNTCMKCHSNKSEFCDRCHNYSAVTPNCWNCHIAPEEKT